MQQCIYPVLTRVGKGKFAEHMKRVIEMWMMTRFVDAAVKSKEAKDPDLAERESRRMYPQIKSIAQIYAKRMGVTYTHASDLLLSCISVPNEYITPHDREINDETAISVSHGKGRDLIDSLIIPWGLLSAIFGKHGTVISFLTGAFALGLLLLFGKATWEALTWVFNLIAQLMR